MKKLLCILLSLVMITGTFTAFAQDAVQNDEIIYNEESQLPDESQAWEDTESDADTGDTVVYPDASITVPSDATVFVGKKGSKHFVTFEEIECAIYVHNGENTTYYYELDDNLTYNYRVSGDNYVTYGGTFKKTPDFNLSVTEQQLMPEGKSKTTVDRDVNLNNGYNVADVYLNINEKGHLKLNTGDTFQIVSLRNWEAVNSTTANYFIEPDYNYEVIDFDGSPSDVVETDHNGLLTANKKGTAIVLVTYDAMTLNYGTSDSFYGAIWPENTGVFVVSVDEEYIDEQTDFVLNQGKNNPEIKLSGDNIDSEHDCIYYIGDMGYYTLDSAMDDIEVCVANPSVDTALTYNGYVEVEKSIDGSYQIPLLTGRNIVRLQTEGKSEYRIITAKQVEISVNNGEAVHPGDDISIVFDKLYHPANKLAGVYNMNSIALYTDVSGYEGRLIGAESAQYNFASKDAAQTICNVLKEKNVWGVINYVTDTALTVPQDYAYDTFSLSGGALYVSGWGDSYGNHRAITYTGGKGANLNADAKLGYLSKLPDIQIPVVATESELVSVTLDAENVKSDYFVGDAFDITGLAVTANYEDGTTQIATNYTVEPKVLSADTQKVTVTYRGMTADIPVTVTEQQTSSGGGCASSGDISVYFTLLGDEKHGSPTGSADMHTNKKGNLETWISKTKISVEKGSYVIDVVKKALSLEGIPYTSDGSYISEIKGLCEFDNGSYSGWMYTVNGSYPELGVNEKKVSNGDSIVFHYTDDYTAEKTQYSGFSGGSGGSGGKISIPVVTAPAKNEKQEMSLDDMLWGAGNYIYNTVKQPTVSSVGGEWAVLGLARSNIDISDSYFENYYNRVKNYVAQCEGKLHSRKYTEYSRVVLALTAIGKNPDDVGGYNLLTPLGDYQKVIWQGINGPVWALVALDSRNYQMPQNSDAKVQATREMYVDYILQKQTHDGGWTLSGDAADPDVTAMVLCALSNYRSNEDVSNAIQKAVDCLSKLQGKDGGYSSNGVGTAESCAQVIVALTSLDIPFDDPRFVKNGNTVLDGIAQYYTEGGFKHTINDTSANLMATEQSFYALVAAKRAQLGKNSLFNMSDVAANNNSVQSVKLPVKIAHIDGTEGLFSKKAFADIINNMLDLAGLLWENINAKTQN